MKQTKGIVMVLFAIFLAAIFMWSPVIFQRGNPIPYVLAAIQITDETPYVPVDMDGAASVYITKKGECPELFEYVEKSRHVELIDQAGSGYIFSNGVDRLVVSSEIYWSNYTVWQVPNKTLAVETTIVMEMVDYSTERNVI